MRDKKTFYRRFTEGSTTLKKTGKNRWQPTTDPFRISLAKVMKELKGSGIDTALWEDVVQDGFLGYLTEVEAKTMRAKYGEASITTFIKNSLKNKCIDAIHEKETERKKRKYFITEASVGDDAAVGFKQMFQDSEEDWDRGVHNAGGKKNPHNPNEPTIGTPEPGGWTHQRTMTPEELYMAAEVGEATREIDYLDLLKEHIVKGVSIKEMAAAAGWSTNRVRKALETGKRNYKKAAEVLGYEYSRDREFMSSLVCDLYKDLGKGGRMKDGIYPEHLRRHNEFSNLLLDYAQIYKGCHECGLTIKASYAFYFNDRVFCFSCVTRHSEPPYVPGRNLIYPRVPEERRWTFDYMLNGINLENLRRFWCQPSPSDDYRIRGRNDTSQLF